MNKKFYERSNRLHRTLQKLVLRKMYGNSPIFKICLIKMTKHTSSILPIVKENLIETTKKKEEEKILPKI